MLGRLLAFLVLSSSVTASPVQLQVYAEAL
jgi:hypothetical protein